MTTFLSNRQVILAFRRKDTLKAEAKAIRTRMTKDAKRLEFLDERIEAVNEVEEIREGIALSRLGLVRPVAHHDQRRWGRIFLNAHNRTTWGIYFCVWLEDGGNAEVWAGANHPTKAHVTRLLEDWVLRGKLPDGVSFGSRGMYGKKFDPLTGNTIYD